VIPQSAIPVLAAGGAALVGANLVATADYLAVVVVPDEQVAAQNAVPEAAPTADTPGGAAARRLIGKPLTRAMTVRAAARRGASDILKMDCGKESADAAAVAYQRHVAIDRKPLVAGVELWPSGYGAAAIDAIRQRAEQCAQRGGQVTVERRKVAGYPAVLVTVVAGTDTIRTLRWSVGDITLSLTGEDIPVDDAAIRGWSRRASTLLEPICADLTPAVKDARRSPWRDPERYRGLSDSTVVTADLPSIAEAIPPHRPRLRRLARVQRPDPPSGVPYWPAALPARQSFPEEPARPKRPATKRRVTFQIPDPTGPGCGWSFTASPKPDFTPAESEAQRNQRVAATTQELDEELTRWAEAESQWRGAMVGYYADALIYREYAGKVATVARAWDAIRADWGRYYQLVAQRQQAIAQRQQWQAAAKAWQATGCSSRTPAPKPASGSGSKKQAAPAPGCAVPSILWKPMPQIPPEPSPPADPRPRSAR
jgi:hypothetical protein